MRATNTVDKFPLELLTSANSISITQAELEDVHMENIDLKKIITELSRRNRNDTYDFNAVISKQNKEINKLKMEINALKISLHGAQNCSK